MKYMSFDIEATGLGEECLIIEFAMIPFDASTKTINHDLKFHTYVQCPSFEKLKPTLDPWVIEHNEELIKKAHSDGLSLEDFKSSMENYLESEAVKEYFNNEKIVLFGKSMSAIDLPFLNRDLGWKWMNKYFLHRNLDLSCFTYGLMDMNLLPQGCDSGDKISNFIGLGDVAHTALEDSINMAKIYLGLLDKLSK